MRHKPPAAIEWIADRYHIRTAFGIVSDPSDRSREVGERRYTLDALARSVTVNIQTMKIVDTTQLEVRCQQLARST